VDIEEKNWYKLHAATYVQGNETACEMGVGLHNVSGNAEHLVLSGEIGSERSNQFTATFEQPKPMGLPITVRCHATMHGRMRRCMGAWAHAWRMVHGHGSCLDDHLYRSFQLGDGLGLQCTFS
jgi:hypothetical protein